MRPEVVLGGGADGVLLRPSHGYAYESKGSVGFYAY